MRKRDKWPANEMTLEYKMENFQFFWFSGAANE